MTPKEIEEGFEGIMDLMVKARWLHRYTYEDGKGFSPVWTQKGAFRALRLKRIAIELSLDESDLAPMRFDILANGGRLDNAVTVEIAPETARYWNESVEDLGIAREADVLLFLVHVILSQAPDEETMIEFGVE